MELFSVLLQLTEDSEFKPTHFSRSLRQNLSPGLRLGWGGRGEGRVYV